MPFGFGFEISELKTMEKCGRDLMLIDLEAKDTLAGAAASTRSVKIEGIGLCGKEREETVEIRSLNSAEAAQAKKGRLADLGFKPNRVTWVVSWRHRDAFLSTPRQPKRAGALAACPCTCPQLWARSLGTVHHHHRRVNPVSSLVCLSKQQAWSRFNGWASAQFQQ